MSKDYNRGSSRKFEQLAQGLYRSDFKRTFTTKFKMDAAIKEIQNLLDEMTKLHKLSQATMQQLNNNQLTIGKQVTRKFPNMPKQNHSSAPKTLNGERPNDLIKFFEDHERLFTTCNVAEDENAAYIERDTSGAPRGYAILSVTFKNGDYAATKNQTLETYGSPHLKPKTTLADLRTMTDRSALSEITDRDDYLHRKVRFETMVQDLKDRQVVLSDSDLNRFFMNMFTEPRRATINNRLRDRGEFDPFGDAPERPR